MTHEKHPPQTSPYSDLKIENLGPDPEHSGFTRFLVAAKDDATGKRVECTMHLTGRGLEFSNAWLIEKATEYFERSN